MVVDGPGRHTDGSNARPLARMLEAARAAVRDLEEWLLSEEARKLPLHEIELEQERRNREIQRLLFRAHVYARGAGAADRTGERRGHPAPPRGHLPGHARREAPPDAEDLGAPLGPGDPDVGPAAPPPSA